jgi:hypothetical protein
MVCVVFGWRVESKVQVITFNIMHVLPTILVIVYSSLFQVLAWTEHSRFHTYAEGNFGNQTIPVEEQACVVRLYLHIFQAALSPNISTNYQGECLRGQRWPCLLADVSADGPINLSTRIMRW